MTRVWNLAAVVVTAAALIGCTGPQPAHPEPDRPAAAGDAGGSPPATAAPRTGGGGASAASAATPGAAPAAGAGVAANTSDTASPGGGGSRPGGAASAEPTPTGTAPPVLEGKALLAGWEGAQATKSVAAGALLPPRQTPYGVRVARLADDHPLAQAGLRAGDVILAWGATAVTTWAELEAAVAGGKAANLRVERGGTSLVLALP